jgi:hypothetical protein
MSPPAGPPSRRLALPLAWALLASPACTPAGYDAAAKTDIDRRVTLLGPPSSTFPAPTATALRPLAIGQWTQHKGLDQLGRPSFVTIKLVGEDLGSYWVEIVEETYLGRNAGKMLVYLGDRTNAAAIDIKILKTMDKRGQVSEVDPRLPEARAAWQGFLSVLATSWQGLPQEDASVPAGAFTSCWKGIAPAGWGPFPGRSTTWWHPAVPLSGLVRTQSLDQPTSLELVAFGDRGAVSEIQ